jgi:hypothetical protein
LTIKFGGKKEKGNGEKNESLHIPGNETCDIAASH